MNRRLTWEETKECLIAWQEHGDKKAQETLVIANMGLIRYFANLYREKGLTYDELCSAGYEGIFNAINKFDYKREENANLNSFSSYISIAIQNQMTRDLKQYQKHSHVLSFDQPIGRSKDGDDKTIEDIVGTDAEELLDDILTEIKSEIVRNALKCLTSTEQKIILLRYGLDEAHRKTYREIAEILGCSHQSVEQTEKKALIKMRHPRNTKKLKDFLDE